VHDLNLRLLVFKSNVWYTMSWGPVGAAFNFLAALSNGRHARFLEILGQLAEDLKLSCNLRTPENHRFHSYSLCLTPRLSSNALELVSFESFLSWYVPCWVLSVNRLLVNEIYVIPCMASARLSLLVELCLLHQNRLISWIFGELGKVPEHSSTRQCLLRS
jgi:hypothetical protein